MEHKIVFTKFDGTKFLDESFVTEEPNDCIILVGDIVEIFYNKLKLGEAVVTERKKRFAIYDLSLRYTEVNKKNQYELMKIWDDGFLKVLNNEVK